MAKSCTGNPKVRRPFVSAVRTVEPGHPRGQAPLASVLRQFREAEAAWAKEKTTMKREVEHERKRANKLEMSLKRLQCHCEGRAMDIKALKAALAQRDSQLEASQSRVGQLEVEMLRMQDQLGSKVTELTADREELQSLLTATLERLEAVDVAMHRAGKSSAHMQQRVASLELERIKALREAADAKRTASQLNEDNRKMAWQTELLDRMTQLQVKHQKRKQSAMQQLLQPSVCVADVTTDLMTTAMSDDDQADAEPGGAERSLAQPSAEDADDSNGGAEAAGAAREHSGPSPGLDTTDTEIERILSRSKLPKEVQVALAQAAATSGS